MNFPPVDGGKGDPSNTVGNPGQYLSISSKATDGEKETAKKFLSNNTLDDAAVEAWVKSGNIPVVKGAKDKLASVTDQNDNEWLKFVYDTSANAKTFAQSWDQALSPAAAETLLDNIAKLFQLSITPQQFADNMNAVHREVTAVVPPGARRPWCDPLPQAPGGAARWPGWCCPPWRCSSCSASSRWSACSC